MGLKARAELWYCTLMWISLNQGRILLLAWQNCCLSTTKEGLNVPHGKTPDPVQCYCRKVLFSSTRTLPHVGTVTLPSAHWQTHCPVSLHVPVTVLSLPAPSEITWGVLRYSQSFWDSCFLPDFYKEEGAAPLKLALRSLAGEWYDSGVANCVDSWSGYFVWVS